MRDKPAPAEWTMEDVAKLWASSSFEGIAQAHNTALAAERQKYNHAVDHLTQLGVETAHKLEEQLAAEPAKVERCEVCNSELSQCGVQGIDGEPSLDCLVCKLRDQLAAEREKSEDAHICDLCGGVINTLEDEREERNMWAAEVVKLKEQLAAERSKVKELEERLRVLT